MNNSDIDFIENQRRTMNESALNFLLPVVVSPRHGNEIARRITGTRQHRQRTKKIVASKRWDLKTRNVYWARYTYTYTVYVYVYVWTDNECQ